MTANDDNTAAWIPGTIRDPITAANIARVNSDGSLNVTVVGGSGGALAGRLLAIQRFATHQTVTPTYNAATTSILIKLLGAGGGGRSVAAPGASVVAMGSGGHGGAYLEKYLTSGFSGKQLVVGTKGTGGAAAGAPNSGTDGTATTFDAGGANYSAGGGPGGTATDSAPYGWIVLRAGTAVASNGDLNVTGGTLNNTSVAASGSPSAMSLGGNPGAPQYGSGGASNTVVATTASAGGNGTGNGSGGSGGITFNGNTPLKGGDGTDGYAEIWEFS